MDETEFKEWRSATETRLAFLEKARAVDDYRYEQIEKNIEGINNSMSRMFWLVATAIITAVIAAYINRGGL